MNALEAGSTLGSYEILARLRAGAMGVLYLARRKGPAGFSRPVAIKVIHEHLAANKRFCRMFIDEAKLSARIDDPNVVRVEEFGQIDGRFFLVMEYVHGASLAQTIAVMRTQGGLPIEHAIQIGIQIAGGLHGAHEATDEDGGPLGIVHRDVSPHNILVSYKGYVRVIDFGIAKAKQVGGQTQTGSLRGKLAYMPPEQARSARTVDRRADVYAAGLVIWEMLTSRRLFDADTELAVLNQIQNPVIVPPSALAPNVPKAVDDVIMKALQREPEARYASAAQLQRALADALPAALRVLPIDLGALMTKVRATASSLADGSEDPSGLYGIEVMRTLTIFGKSMHDSVELANEISDDADTSPDVRGSSASTGRSSSVFVEEAAGDKDTVGTVTVVRSARPAPQPVPVAAAPSAQPSLPPIAVFALIFAGACLIAMLIVVTGRRTDTPAAAPSSSTVTVVPMPTVPPIIMSTATAGPESEVSSIPSGATIIGVTAPQPSAKRVRDAGTPRPPTPPGLPMSRF